MNTSQIKERILSEQRKYDNEHYPKDFWAESAANKITGDIITLLKEHADCKKWHRINKPEGYYMHTYISYIIESLSQPSVAVSRNAEQTSETDSKKVLDDGTHAGEKTPATGDEQRNKSPDSSEQTSTSIDGWPVTDFFCEDCGQHVVSSEHVRGVNCADNVSIKYLDSLSQPSDSGTAHPQPDMQITNKEGSAQWRLGELKTKRKDRDDLKEESPKHAPRNGFGCKGKQECCSLEEFQTYGCDCPCHKQDDKLGCDGWGDSVRDKDGVIIIDECGCSCHNKKEEEE